jgi:hypothetical protein
MQVRADQDFRLVHGGGRDPNTTAADQEQERGLEVLLVDESSALWPGFRA